MSGGVVDRANAGFEDDRMSDDITTDQATYDALVRDAILWRKGQAMRPDDMIVWEAWGMVQQFAQSNPTCPEYFRGRVKEYQDRIAASRAIPEPQLYPNLEQPDTRDAAPVPEPQLYPNLEQPDTRVAAPTPDKGTE